MSQREPVSPTKLRRVLRQQRKPAARRDDPERVARLLQALRSGASLQTARMYARLSKETVGRWIARGRANPNGPYGLLAQSIDEARAIPLLAAHVGWRKGFEKDWKASMEFVIRRDQSFRLPRESGPDAQIGVALNLQLQNAGAEVERAAFDRLKQQLERERQKLDQWLKSGLIGHDAAERRWAAIQQDVAAERRMLTASDTADAEDLDSTEA
jgi:hypothetical protein